MSTFDEREAAFIAAVTASATHELRNVLAIVKESAGLIEDLTQSGAGRGAPDPARVLRCTERIATQVARGAELLTGLNRFAHGLEHPTARLQLDQEIRLAALLDQRLVRQRGHTVAVRAGDPDLMIRANPLRLQMALFAALECSAERLAEPGVLTLRAATHEGRPAVEIAVEATEGGPTAGAPPGWDRVVQLVESLGGSVEAADPGRRFRLHWPAASRD
jgi:C4-dicarboxylate-specific signal transduction histidine kinase